MGKGLIKGSAVGIPQLLLNNMFDEEEKNVIEKNKEIEQNIKYQIRSDNNIIAKKI